MKTEKILHLAIAVACAACALNVGAQTSSGSSASSSETMSEKISDGAITTKVKAALLNAKDVQGSQNIHVTTTAGAVRLSGTVPSKASKEAATAAAKTVDGVTRVRNDLKVGG
jgi:hyperosmotically inducible periplasmic protein